MPRGRERMERMTTGLSQKFFATAFAGVRAEVREGAFDGARARDAAMQFVADAFPRARCAILFGSVRSGEQKAWSDIDVLLVLPGEVAAEKRCAIVAGYPVEYYLYDVPTLHAALDPATGWAAPTLAAALLGGELIGGDAALAQSLAQTARAFTAAPRPAPAGAALNNARGMATSFMLELATNPAHDEQVAIAAQLYTLLTGLVVQKASGVRNGPKWTARLLKQIDPALSEGLQQGLAQLAAGGSPAVFLAQCETMLERIGGPLWDGYRGPVARG
jgi:hypothetical protein